MSTITSVQTRSSVVELSTSSWPSNRFLVARLWRELLRELWSSYWPELHYMRGPGPRWQEKHVAVSALNGAAQFGTGAPWRDAQQRRGATPR